MESPSIQVVGASPDCAAGAAGDNAARADRLLGRESDPETRIIARTTGFARIDFSSAHALNYGDKSARPQERPSLQPADRVMSILAYTYVDHG